MTYKQLVEDLEVLEVATYKVRDPRVSRRIASVIVDVYSEVYADLSPAEKLAVSRGLRTAEWYSAGKVLAEEIGDPEGWSAAIYKGRHLGNCVIEYYIRDEHLEDRNETTEKVSEALEIARATIDPANRPWG